MKYLEEISAWHRVRAADEMTSALESGTLIDRVMDSGPADSEQGGPLPFSSALSDFGIIAEIKRKSPSKGELNPDLDPAQLARDLADGGAACLSVLTDGKFFGGSLEDLKSAKESVPDLPVLRKDFTFCVLDIINAAEAGADAVLLIMAALEDSEASELYLQGAKCGVDVLFEIHTEQELERVLSVYEAVAAADSPFVLPPLCIMVNQRNLKTFEEHPGKAMELLPALPKDAVKIAASGIQSAGTIKELKDAGYNGVLVGEYLMTSDDPANTLKKTLTELAAEV